MINSKGTTLPEILITCAIIGILGTALGFAYAGWIGGYDVEKQIKDIYADLMTARIRAISDNRTFFLEFTDATTYRIVEDTNDNNKLSVTSGDTVIPSFPKKVGYANKANGYGIPLTISFDPRGLMSPLRTIWIVHETDSDYDCLVISSTRVNMGKMNQNSCVHK